MSEPHPTKQSTLSGGIFGLSYAREESLIAIQPVAWEVTTSYGSGTSRGPEAILAASPQLDLFDLEFGNAYKAGYFLAPADPFFKKINDALKPLAQEIIKEWDETGEISESSRRIHEKINSGCAEMVRHVYSFAQNVLAEDKIPGLIGGDHSTPLGAIQAISEKLSGAFGVLHIDAHADLRNQYQGFTHSHASIMRNVMSLPVPPQKLVQVAIRDFCDEEYQYIQQNEGRIFTHFDQHLKSALFGGETWDTICKRIVAQLPQNVYVSFDIDGLSPEFCPNTGTPVPGGLSYDQATHLLSVLGRSGKCIVGFDLNEVAPGDSSAEWDGNVGARILFKLCGWAAKTNEK